MMTDPIADMLNRIKNAIHAGQTSLVLPSSTMKLALANVLKEEGFIQSYDLLPEQPQAKIRIWLKYAGERRERRPVITGIKRVSKPGCRVYVGKNSIPWIRSGVGIAILSTPKGILADRQARKMGVGGEVICYVW